MLGGSQYARSNACDRRPKARRALTGLKGGATLTDGRVYPY
jgi:hypothetical protein